MCVRFHSRDIMSCSAFLLIVAGDIFLPPPPWARSGAARAEKKTIDAAKDTEEFTNDFTWFFIPGTSFLLDKTWRCGEVYARHLAVAIIISAPEADRGQTTERKKGGGECRHLPTSRALC